MPPAVFEMYARADMNRWLEHESMTALEEAERRVRARIGLFDKGLGCRWAITVKEQPEEVIGSCGYFSVRIGTQTFELGFELHPNFWHQGLMTEALIAILDASFHPGAIYPVHRLEALVDPGNQASLQLLARLGFSQESTRREFGYWKGSYRDVAILVMLSHEWGK